MKGGANLEDQLAISRAVVDSAENNDCVLDVPLLAANLNIPLDCCQSYVDFYAEKHGVALKNPIDVVAKPKKSGKGKASDDSDSIFG